MKKTFAISLEVNHCHRY